MAIFEVYLPDGKSIDDAIAGFAEPRFLRDGVSVLGLLIPIVFLLWHRLWLELFAYVLLMIFIIGLGGTEWAPATMAISFLPGVFLFLEGSNLIAAKWRRQDWRLVALCDGDSKAEAEIRFFSRHREVGDRLQSRSASSRPTSESPISHKPSKNQPRNPDATGIGLFPEG